MNSADGASAHWQRIFLEALDEGIPPNPLRREGIGVNVRQRFQVYVNQAHLGLYETLASIYPAVMRLVGETFFSHLATRYIASHYLEQANLHSYGHELPGFIESFPALEELGYLPDVARLEWACHESLHADHGNFSCVQANLTLAPHVRLLHSSFPIAEIWDFALREHAPEERLNINHTKDSYLLIARPDLDVEIMALEPSDWLWLHNACFKIDTQSANFSQNTRYWFDQNILSVSQQEGREHEEIDPKT